MRKAERLFQLVDILRSRRQVVTARQLSEQLEVSERTVYRDIEALSLSGVPIEAAAGVGYRLKPGFHLPPLMFDLDELEALRLGIRMVQGWSDTTLAHSAARALEKIQAILPNNLHHQLVHPPEQLIVPDIYRSDACPFSEELRQALKSQSQIDIDYEDESGQSSSRIVWPLGMIYWGRNWTLVAWCTLRENYRMFRLDRIQRLQLLPLHFVPTPEINLQHYLDQHTR